MSRIRQVDIDTYIGYNYLIEKYFISNKNTMTYRATTEEAKAVLDIVAPNNSITLEILEALANDYETLSSISYTLSDTGAYISTIQINDYADYPIELRAETNKLIIRNTNIVFDLMLNEDKGTRVAIMQAYFREHLGLSLTMTELIAIYDFMLNTYKPYVYPLILETNTTPIYYSNSFACSNFNNTGKSTYQCDLNPYEQYNNTVIENIGLINADSATNTLTFSNTIPDTLKVGDTIIIEGATTVLDTYTYTADGTYTIKTINNNTIVTKEGLTGSYTYNYPLVYLTNSEMDIESIDRDTSTVTVTNNVPNSVQVGDIVYIKGTEQRVEGISVNCDGEYTIGSISGNTFTTQTPPPTSYTYIPQPIAYTKLVVSTIESVIKEQSAIVTSQTPSGIVANSLIYIDIPEGFKGMYTVESVDYLNKTIYLKEQPPADYTKPLNPPYATYSFLTSLGTVESISSSRITLTTTPVSVPNSSTILVTYNNTETLYAYISKDGNTLTCNYISGELTYYYKQEMPTATKRVYIGEAQSIQREETSGTLSPYFYITLNSIEGGIIPYTELLVIYNNTETHFITLSISNNTIYCQYLYGSLTEYEVNYPNICVPTPYPEIFISVTASSNEETFPIGEFMVDDFSQCKAYIGLLEGNTIPPDSVYAKLGTEVGSEEVIISISGESPYILNYLGLYSQVYGENNDNIY